MIFAVPFRSGPSRRDTLLGWFNVAANREMNEERGRNLITEAMAEWCQATQEGAAFAKKVTGTLDAVTLGQHFTGKVPASLTPYLMKRGIEIIRVQPSPLLEAA